MRPPWRPPLLALAIGLLGLILLLATLQYVWLGRISEGERDRLRATLVAHASDFAQDFDRELTRAYLLFQTDTPGDGGEAADRFAERFDRWQATSAYPRLVREFHLATRNASGELELRRFDPAPRTLTAAPWPPAMADWRSRLDHPEERPPAGSGLFIRRLPPPIWESVPALVVPSPMLFVREGPEPPPLAPRISFTLLTIDLDYVRRDMLPALTQRHFRKAAASHDYQVAVVENGAASPVYQSTPAFHPRDAAAGDAAAPLFQVRTQDFGAVAAEVRRFTTFTMGRRLEHEVLRRNAERGGQRESTQMSIVVQQGSPEDGPGRGAPPGTGRPAPAPPRWHVVVKHSAGSLEAYVGSTRRRNLAVSTGILAILAASMALLVVSTRRSQELARRQLEFVAAVSHELRTPLAVIRSAGENLADGVVHDEARVRKYGEVIRAEGRRLSEMVEQILELAGIQSGQRGFVRRPVAIAPILEDVLSSFASLLEEAGIRVETTVPAGLPSVAGDPAGLRRVFQNLIGNAMKYGAAGGWIGLRASTEAGQLHVAVADRGIGIEPAEQDRIFEPFYRGSHAAGAQMPGAGLGLSLVKRIVDAHGGRIVVNSTPGEGSEFIVSLPLAGSEERSLESSRAAGAAATPASS